MDALDLLEQQHRDIRAMLDRIATDPSPTERAAIVAQVALLIDVHTRAEARFVYVPCAPMLRRDDRSRFHEACERHALTRAAAASLARTRPSSASFAPRLKQLREVFVAHELEDECWIFQRAKASMTDEQLDAIGEQIAQDQSGRAKDRSSSASPNAVQGRAEQTSDGDGPAPSAEEAGDPKGDHRHAQDDESARGPSTRQRRREAHGALRNE
jgi:hypothetical protein